MQTKNRNYNNPTALYGSETWVMTKEKQNNLLRWEKSRLQKIYGGKKHNVWERRTNKETYNLFNKIKLIK